MAITERIRTAEETPTGNRSPLSYIYDARVAAMELLENPFVSGRVKRLAAFNAALPAEDRLNHVAVILDGNRRDALYHGVDKSMAHKIGAQRVLHLLPPFARLGIKNLSLWGASTGNYERGPEEWERICGAMEHACEKGLGPIVEAGGRVRHAGRTDRITPSLKSTLTHAEDVTAQGRRFTIWVLADYSEEYEQERDHQSVVRATEAGLLKSDEITWELDKFITETVRIVPRMQLVIRSGLENKGDLAYLSDLGRAAGDAYIHSIRATLPHTRTMEFLDGVENWLNTSKRKRK